MPMILSEEGKTKCNLCGKVFDQIDRINNAGFCHVFGYGSERDGEAIEFHFCCQCNDRLCKELKARSVFAPEESEIN